MAMDPLTSDSYSVYSDPSTPRTPSPIALIQYPAVYANDYKGSLLNELYEQEMPSEYQHIDWQRPPSDYPSNYPIRRTSFPYVRHDQQYPAYEQDVHYSWRQEPYSSYHDLEDPNIKLEDTSPITVQQQSNFYRSPPSSHQMPMPYLPPHNNIPVQHTDDAASKETQYLRRRCFNCHTTEPPSWRRSTLNPGKIVCNKCGLYERTHLRPRPLRFDELRSRSKCRKSSKSISNPKQSKVTMVKKEPADFGYDRRSSVSSASSAHSAYSRDSHSPPQDGRIRLPNNPLSDVASMVHTSTTNGILSLSVPRKSHTTPANFYSPPSLSDINLVCQVPDYYSHSQNGASPEDALWVESTEMNSSGLVSTPTGSL
jgi:GATA-binding protein